MKKKVFAAASLVLAATAVFSVTGCASKKVEKLLPKDGISYSSSTKQLNINSAMPVELEVDDTGLALVVSSSYAGDTQYSLFNVRDNKYINNASVTISSMSGMSMQTPMTKATDGFYFYTTSAYGMGGMGSSTMYTTYTLLDKTGIVASNVEGSFNGSVFYAKDGTRYYLGVDGKVKKEKDPLARVLDSTPYKVGEYYVVMNRDSLTVYSADGVYERYVDIDVRANKSESATDEYSYWYLDNYVFYQYSQMLPDDSKKYDYISLDEQTNTLKKYDLVTKRYDLKKDKVKDIEMDYVVEEPVMIGNDKTIVLYASEIIDGQLMSYEIVQSFNKNGKVAVDLQALVPGAEDIEHVANETVVLCAGDTDYVVQGRKVVAQFPCESVRYERNTAVLSSGGNLYFYNLEGGVAKTYTGYKNVAKGFGYYLIQTETGVVKYDTQAKKESKLYETNSYYAATETVTVDPSGMFITVYNSMSNSMKYIYAEKGIDALESNPSMGTSYQIDASVGSYGFVEGSSYISGKIFAIASTSMMGMTTYTYYLYETVEFDS